MQVRINHTSDAVLSSKNPIAYIDLRVFSHATEDIEKVLTAVRNTLPAEVTDALVFRRSNLTGHHGNPITLIETKIKDKSLALPAFERLARSLHGLDKESLRSGIHEHIEKGNLYIRLDKQSAFLGELGLSQTDPIHLKIHFKKSDPQEVIKVCRKVGLLP